MKSAKEDRGLSLNAELEGVLKLGLDPIFDIFDVSITERNNLYEAIVLADVAIIDAQRQEAAYDREKALKAILQAKLVDPCIDGEFGTVDVKQVGENFMEWLSAGKQVKNDQQ